MDAILTPYPEVNNTILEIYESFYYDDVDNNVTFGINAFEEGAFDELIEPRNLETEFAQEEDLPFHIGDMIADISACYPTSSLKDIAYKVGGIYCNNAETMESFVPGQRIGDYEYITLETDYAVILFGRKQSTDDYSTIHFWLK